MLVRTSLSWGGGWELTPLYRDDHLETKVLLPRGEGPR